MADTGPFLDIRPQTQAHPQSFRHPCPPHLSLFLFGAMKWREIELLVGGYFIFTGMVLRGEEELDGANEDHS